MSTTLTRTPPRTTFAFDDIRSELIRLETELDLCDRTVDGVHFWELVRVPVCDHIGRELGLLRPSQDRPPNGPIARLRSAASVAGSVITKNPFNAAPADVLFIGHPRRRLDDHGRWMDVYCDPIIEDVLRPEGLSSLVVERPFLHRHMAPPRTRNLRHLDAIAALSAMGRTLRRVSLSPNDALLVDELDEQLGDTFGVEVRLRRHVQRALDLRDSQLPLYDKLLEIVAPKLVFIVVSYGNETITEAARARGIPTAELQHGVIAPEHLGYSYPGDLTKRAFPDYFISFGEFWSSWVDLPLPDEKVIDAGFIHFERESARYDDTTPRRQILFISQKTIGEPLSRCAAELAGRDDHGYDVVYKLHPSELDSWKSSYPWLADAKVRVIDDDDVPLYRLMAESRAQVGVYSTAVFEGLAFGLETYVLDVPGAEVMRDVIERTPTASLRQGAADIAAAIADLDLVAKQPSDEFFRRGSAERMREFVKESVQRA